ncbi:IS66 family transposase [Bradyrhizobium yuanmingense]|uniref:IS66 family transposase n=1 Tax=Bradyrhizobium yuanmingense TaxID=108015 RepID=UPI003B968AD5
MRQQRTLLSSGNDTAKAINYLLNRWAAFTRFLDDGRICLSNNAAERALRGVAVGRRNWNLRRFRCWRQSCRRCLYPDRNLQDERR